MPISSNRRQRVIEYATPKVADLVVVERVDCSKNVSSADAADDTYGSDYGDAHPDATNFSGFNLALIKNGDNDQGQFQDWYYVKDRADQDDYNWEFQAAGASTPRFDTVVRTYVTLRSAFDEYSPAIGNANGMPTVADDPFTDAGSGYDTAYVFFEKKQVRSGDETLDTLYVVEQHIFVKRVTIVSVDADKQFPYNDSSIAGEPYGGLISKETLYYKNEVVYATTDFSDADEDTAGIQTTGYRVFSVYDAAANKTKAEYVFTNNAAVYQYSTGGSPDTYNFWGVDNLGVMREGKQLSENWYVLSERQVIRLGTNGLVASYTTNQNVSWPPVFGGLYAQVWNRRDGGRQTNVYPVFKREGYSGPTKVLIQQYWRKLPYLAPTDVTGSTIKLTLVKPMEALPMEFATPNWRVKVKPSLHNLVELTYTNGTEDPVWVYGGYVASWKATNYTDWQTLVIQDSQEPLRGGYLRTKVTAYEPHIDRSDTDTDFGVPPALDEED